MELNQVNAKLDALHRTEQQGDYAETARLYDELLTFLAGVKRAGGADVDQTLRSLAFNYAHFRNKHFHGYTRALQAVELGMACSPTGFGVSVGLAAKGEALWGLGRKEEAMQAFRVAAEAHPINGRIESAYCMVRLEDPELLPIAAAWVESAVKNYSQHFNDHPDWIRQVSVVRAAAAAQSAPAGKPKASFLDRLLGKK